MRSNREILFNNFTVDGFVCCSGKMTNVTRTKNISANVFTKLNGKYLVRPIITLCRRLCM